MGGGNIGLQVAAGLRKMGVSPTIVVRSPFLLSQLADQKTGDIYRDVFEENGIAVKTGCDVEEITGKDRVKTPKGDGKRKCEVCGFKIRGKDHENGSHHRSKA